MFWQMRSKSTPKALDNSAQGETLGKPR